LLVVRPVTIVKIQYFMFKTTLGMSFIQTVKLTALPLFRISLNNVLDESSQVHRSPSNPTV
jgi:hypothetical protein